MNEFLKSMRANKEKQRRRGYNQYSQGGNPQYRNENPQFRKDNGNVKKGNGHSLPSDRVAELLNETLPTLKSLMETLTEHQRSIIDTGERRADAEERRARAMESIAESLQYLMGAGALSLPETAERPVEVRPALTANANRPDRDSVLSIIFSMRDEGATYGQIAGHLDSLHIPTFSGKGRWHAQTVHRVCKNRS
ncbi:MAG: hypothetical protein ACLFRG_17200 [Desulfococcaceae bacterium]